MNLFLPVLRSRATRNAALYLLMLAGAALVFVVILNSSHGLNAAVVQYPPVNNGSSSERGETLSHLLLALLVLIVACRTVGCIFRWIGQPPVVGEIVAGILLGPSLLGRFAPGISAYLLPHDVTPMLGMLAQLGVILYMFLVGLEFDPSILRRRGPAAIAISHASIIAPFLLGAALALGIYPIVSGGDVPFVSFALFLGVSMSVTAFPVLARILLDRHMMESSLGSMALACAAMDDVTAWCLLAIVTGVARAALAEAITVTTLTFLYVSAMFLVVRPLLAGLHSIFDKGESTTAMAVAIVTVLFSAWLTECIGIHAIFGAFLFGAVIPRNSPLAATLQKKLADVVSVIFLPVFFAFAGMRTQIDLIHGPENWLLCGIIIVVASVGKFGGTSVAARLCGFDWRSSCALGILMNTRGLMELIVLNIGLDLGLISPRLYALMVVMAVTTTMMTAPILAFLVGNRGGRSRVAGIA